MRRLHNLSIAIAISLALPAMLRGGGDVATLSDGDRISGTLQKLEKGKLYFKTKHSETALEIDWAAVKTLETDQDLAITLADGTERSGIGAISALAMSSISSLVPRQAPADEEAAKKISVSADFGQSYSGLTGYNQISFNTEVSYAGDRWDGNMATHLDYYGSSESAASTYQAYGRVTAQRYIRGDRFFLFPYAFLGRQTTAEGRGQIRQYGGGAGWTFGRQKPDQLSLYGGVIRSTGTGFKESPEAEQRLEQHLDEPLFIGAISWDKKLKNKVTASVRLYYFKPMLEQGRHGMATDASLKIPLFGPAYLSLRAYDTPELGQRQLFSTKNLQLTSGIGVEF
jgi:hypothetical protein